jgi:hypothetical protein
VAESILHPDLVRLLDMLFSVAQPLLSQHGEFYPFGAVMLQDGAVQHVSAKIEGDNDPQSVIDLLTETFQKESRKGQVACRWNIL